VHRRLTAAGHGPSVRQLAAAGAVVATLGAMFLLPGNPDPVPVPAPLLWDFRVLSMASHGLMWGALGVVFGTLGLRAARGAGDPVSSTAAAGADGAQAGREPVK
jgi:hypothetical protein